MTPRCFLVVDDDPAVRQALEKAITRRGDQVLLASSGEQACVILGQHAVHAVLLDLRMPMMSGQTVFHVILTQWPHLASRVIILSADPEAQEHHEWLRMYSLPVMSKPFELTQVFRVLDAIVADDQRLQANGH